MADARQSPVVIVSRTATRGKEGALRAWLQQVAAAARQAPGFVALEITTDEVDGQLVSTVTYRFRDPESLDAWLASPTRHELLHDGRDLLAAEPVEQRLAVPGLQPVTAVSSVRVRPGQLEAFRREHEHVLQELAQQPGFVDAELFEPVLGVQDEAVVVFSFGTREQLDDWLRSGARAAALARLEALTEGERTVNLVGGFAGWFPTPGPEHPAKRWKSALVVLAALFPTALLLGTLQRAVAPDLSAPVATFVGNVAGVAILTWLLMPPLTRALAPWLRR